MYKLYGSVKSRAFRVLWMLEELGEPFEFFNYTPHHPEVLALNTSGKVPVLVDGENVITDSMAVLSYMADKHGKMTATPGTVERAKQDAMTNLWLDEFDAVLWTAARHSFILPEEKRVPEVKDSLKWEFARNLARQGKQFTGPFLMGGSFSIADVVATQCLNWALVAGFPVEDQTMRAYARDMRERPAFKRAMAYLDN